mmetsp:Transcript_5470/g.8098  ORF Transcript_5470/g.8098 Transcript_5470/m.8098 type:complete len:135 (+) Transcript_5470:431-835(+)
MCGMGHLINHPPPNQPPNVYALHFLWSDLLPLLKERILAEGADPSELDLIASELNRIPIHCPWFLCDSAVVSLSAAAAAGVPTAGVALLTQQQVAVGEEFLLDYQLQPERSFLSRLLTGQSPRHPSWYRPVRRS